jgi:hypothetical protein
MLEQLYARYASLVCDVHRWKQRFQDFAGHLAELGCPFDNSVMFIDSHFQPTTRPGGEGCINLNMEDFQTFAGKERLHGLKYQGAVFPNGIACVWGP